MKTTVLIPDELFAAADALAGRLGISRSDLYTAAVAEFVATHDANEVTARLDQLYATEPSGLDPALRRAQRRRSAPTESPFTNASLLPRHPAGAMNRGPYACTE